MNKSTKEKDVNVDAILDKLLMVKGYKHFNLKEKNQTPKLI